ncbi:MAG: TIGR01777 family oxidoreductase [Ferruginibacter sp.]
MQTVLITGGTGLVGKRLTKHLIEKGYKLIILTRSLKGKNNSNDISYAAWDIRRQAIDIKAVQSADIIIHLAGAGVVDKRWTEQYQKEILESRTMSSKLITDTLRAHSNRVKTIVSSSAIGWYGPDKDKGRHFIETDEHANDFLGQTCYAWEQSIEAASSLNTRVCKLRTGIVLSKEGGALEEFRKPLRFGIAAILGNGKQMISWIHIDDLCRMFIYAIENQALNGSYNAVAAMPVSNKQLTLTLAVALKGNFFVPVHIPVFVLKLVMGGSSVEVLKSTTVSNKKITAAGFTFMYPTVGSALAEITGK